MEPEEYEVEIQLGKTDESHIIGTVQYWDIERKRYPHCEHTAGIAAGKESSPSAGFLNVIRLLQQAPFS